MVIGIELITFWVLVFFFGLIITYIGKRQVERAKVYSSFEEIEGNVFVLFLRSFDEDGSNPETKTSTFAPFGVMKLSYEIDVAQYLNTHLNIPLIKVDDPRGSHEISGASTLKLADDWQKHVLKLMALAQFIIIKPANTPGIHWEIEQIYLRDYSYKTLFLMRFGKDEPREVIDVLKLRFFSLLKSKFNMQFKEKKLWMFKYIYFINNSLTGSFWLQTCPHVDDLKKRVDKIKSSTDEFLLDSFENDDEIKIEELAIISQELIERKHDIELIIE